MGTINDFAWDRLQCHALIDQISEQGIKKALESLRDIWLFNRDPNVKLRQINTIGEPELLAERM